MASLRPIFSFVLLLLGRCSIVSECFFLCAIVDSTLQSDAYLRMVYELQGSPQYSTETAVKALMRLPEFSVRYPYLYQFIDKPHGMLLHPVLAPRTSWLTSVAPTTEGDTHIIFLPNGNPRLPNDGIRYLEEQTRMSMNSGSIVRPPSLTHHHIAHSTNHQPLTRHRN